MIAIKKVLNSSVVLVEKDGVEMVALGKGIGFGRKPGDVIDNGNVDKIFLEKNIKTAHVTELIEEIPFDYFEVTRDITNEAEKILGKKLNSNLYLTLTDHIHFAVERAKQGHVLSNKLYWEIKNYYPREFDIGTISLSILNDRFSVELPKEEASNIAFHLINAQSGSEENQDGFKYAKMISSIVNVVKYSINTKIDTSSIHYTRFITHVRFFVERLYSEKLLQDTEEDLYKQMIILYPYAMEIADKTKKYIKKVYEFDVPNEEIAYLGIHINRLIKYTEEN
ncbi:PRD domain-containing protein [Carnobacterium maltaromaticum]|uniref:PRD domain-containing protein n=1 Tax=Carnobacterium maltaromaticum TaxID=2751 RepID=UPI00298B4A1A|nr:PRD domain-containing protein [Carnobacterium maltaromaticum]MDW5524993.1 PRD domain-containing protein [Carnobacterium maltaromaticum]